jgi:hypothetical protein
MTGYIRHVAGAGVLLPIWLGCGNQQPPNWGVDNELDGKLNLSPVAGTPSVCNPAVLTDCVETPTWGPYGQDECYGDLDAGIASPVAFQPCVPQQVTFSVMSLMTQTVATDINVLVDWNGDGDWNDVFQCPSGVCAPEWAVKNWTILVPPGCTQFQTPPILPSYHTGEGWLRITLTHTILPDDYPWNGSAGVPGGLYEDGETEDYPVTIQTPGPCGREYEDFGDAPEAVAAYPSALLGHFPTCIGGTVPGTQEVQCGNPASPPPQITGYVRHYSPAQDPIQYWLGCGDQLTSWGIDREVDGKMNQAPLGTSSFCNQAVMPDCAESPWGGPPFVQDECFGDLDAGVPSPVALGQCTMSQVQYQAYSCAAAPVQAYLNVLVDWNQDGDWNDLISCSSISQCAPEWAVQNAPVMLSPGCASYATPPFRVGPTPGPGWLRITLCDAPVPADFPWNGSVGAPNATLDRGETEDYPVDIVTSGVGAVPAPPSLKLGPALPNPARDYTSLRYSLPSAGRVQITVYDAAGRRVRELVSGLRPAGDNLQPWDYRDGDGARVPAGVYHVRLEFAGRVLIQRVVRLP